MDEWKFAFAEGYTKARWWNWKCNGLRGYILTTLFVERYTILVCCGTDIRNQIPVRKSGIRIMWGGEEKITASYIASFLCHIPFLHLPLCYW